MNQPLYLHKCGTAIGASGNRCRRLLIPVINRGQYLTRSLQTANSN